MPVVTIHGIPPKHINQMERLQELIPEAIASFGGLNLTPDKISVFFSLDRLKTNYTGKIIIFIKIFQSQHLTSDTGNQIAKKVAELVVSTFMTRTVICFIEKLHQEDGFFISK